MRNFFKKIGDTFYSSELYTKARTESFGSIFWFLFKFIVLLSVIAGIIFGILYLSFSPKIKSQVLDYVSMTYPDDLVVTLNDKTLSINRTEPVFFPVPPQLKNDEKLKANVLVLAPTETNSDITLLSKYDSYGVVTSGSLIVENGSGEYRTYVLNYKNNTFTKELIISNINQLFKIFLPIIVAFMIPGAFLVLLFLTIKFFFSLLFVSILLYFVFYLKKINITYGEIYLMGMYSVVPVFLIGMILMPFNLNSSLVNFLIMFVVILYANRNLKSSDMSTVPTPASTDSQVPNENS
jgi:hypothetical protein